MIFYILNNIPTIEASTAADAVHAYALQQGIVSGQVTVATNIKTFDIIDKPRDVQVTEL